MTDSSDTSGKTAAEIALDRADFDRKYLLLSVPDFDVDPVEGEGKRRMTSYLRLGTVPDDWKSLPGAELELAVHADYGLGGGREGLPIAGEDPGGWLPAEPIDDRYLPPTVENLTAMFLEEVEAARAASAGLPEVARWSEVERSRVEESRALARTNAEGAGTVPGEMVTASGVDGAGPTLPETVGAADFAGLVVVDGADVEATLDERLAALALGGPTEPLDDAQAGAAIDAMRLRELVGMVLRPRPATEMPWVLLAPTPFDAAVEAVRADAARRAGARLLEGLTDAPDKLREDGTLKYPVYVDDQRWRGEEGEDTNYLPREQRAVHSKHLHTRGGWRDHSDGNRISTTYGDKIEVIRGNYKLMVLGRQSDPGSSNIVDYSGQVTQSDDNMLVRVEWTQKDGAWNWETINENVIQTERVSGKTYSWWYGVEQVDVTGSDDPVEPSDDNPLGLDGDGLSRANPHQTSRTWARSISDYTGSSRLPVPRTYSETWIDEGEEKTYVTRGTIATTTIGAGTVETTTVGGGTVSTTTVGLGTMDTTAVGGAAISITGVGGAQVDITGVAGAIVELTASLAKVEAAAHAVHVEVAAVGIHAELKRIGIDIEVSSTDLSIKYETSGKELDYSPKKDEVITAKSETFTTYARNSGSDKLTYSTSSETGVSKSLSLSDLRIVAASISLG